MRKIKKEESEEIKNLKISGGISISHGVIREMILSRGWSVNDDSIGTVWSAINKMMYDFIQHVKSVLPRRIEKLEEANKQRMWKKKYLTIEKSVPWYSDVTLSLSSFVNLELDEIHIAGVEVKIRGSSKRYVKPLKEAITQYVNSELEKNLK
jgi:hypothetical protein